MRRLFLNLVICVIVLPTGANASEQNVKGNIELEGVFGISGDRELQVMEPSMCEGSSRFRLSWNKRANRVRLRARFDGLPHKPNMCFASNPSNTYNTWDKCVTEGRWQIWLVGHFFTKEVTLYYDGTTGEILESEFAYQHGAPDGAIPLTVPAGQMVCTDFFESNPKNLKARVKFDFDYDRILDNEGKAGTMFAQAPLNLFDPNSVGTVWVNGGLPASEAMNMDEILAEAESGRGAIFLVTSLEPHPKPSFLASRDNIMIGWGNIYPEAFGGAIGLPQPNVPNECRSFQWFGDTPVPVDPFVP